MRKETKMEETLKPEKPVTVRVKEFQYELNRVVAESQLPPFLLEMILGEMLTGISRVAGKEYEQDKESWEKARKEGESKDGRHQ